MPVLPVASTTLSTVSFGSRAIVAAGVADHAGPMRLAALLDLPASTVGAVIARAGLPRLAAVDQLTGEPLRGRRHSDRRYEHPCAGDMLDVEVKKVGRVPDGGWRIHGRSEQVRRCVMICDYVTSPSPSTLGHRCDSTLGLRAEPVY